MSESDDKLLSELADSYGTPLYVVFESRLQTAYRNFLDAFSKKWPQITIAYSYKTNSLLAVCRLFHSLGAWAEVTSGVELYAAQRLEVQPSHVIFNGPHKTDDELEAIQRMGYCVNIDGWYELERLSALAERLGPCSVGLRVNPGNKQLPHWDKFGFSMTSGDALNAVHRIKHDKNLRLIGLHTHIGTNIANAGLFFESANMVGGFSVRIENIYGAPLQYLDLGGGFATYQPVPYFEDSWSPASLIEYADAIARGLTESGVRSEMQLILEPGRVLTTNTTLLLTRVVEVKTSSDRGFIAIVDTGVNQIPSASWMKHNIRPIHSEQTELVETDIFGNLCMQADLLGVGVRLNRPKPGNLIAIEDVGAYNLSMSYPFIRPRPATVLVKSNGQVEKIRRREKPEDIFALETL